MVSKKLNFGNNRTEKEQNIKTKEFGCVHGFEDEQFDLNLSSCLRSEVHDKEASQAELSLESESQLLLSLENFESDLSPINKVKSKRACLSSFPLHRRERTTTRIVPQNKSNLSPITANTNPFLSSTMVSSKRKRLFSFSSDDCDSDDSGRYSPVDMKRLRISDLSISRYEEEFIELEDLASGSFGSVKLARHRLDGMEYAIKVSKTNLRAGSHEEKAALNEVFAHATLNTHKHVVRYYNSWVEEGQVYIQNEFCQGGSLRNKIEERRECGKNFSEDHLFRILSHTLQGLQYIHSKQLAHLDIKPDNILISFNRDALDPSSCSSDSGIKSEDPSHMMEKIEMHECIRDDNEYKIGDLGHVAQLNGKELAPEEGDCRYMAPEFLLMDIDESQLHKADIFSLGMTIYEAASLKILPRNSLEDPEYESLKLGQLPYLHQYSEEINSLMSIMVFPDPASRPTTTTLLDNYALRHHNTKPLYNLHNQLNEAKLKLKLLEEQLLQEC